MTKLELRVRCVNQTHAIANGLYPKLAELFRPYVGQKILKTTGELLKVIKDQEKALELPHNPKFSVYRDPSDYSLSYLVTGRDWIPSPVTGHSDYSCYHNATIYLGSLKGQTLEGLSIFHELRTDYSADQVLKDREGFLTARKAFEDARSKLDFFGEYDR